MSDDDLFYSLFPAFPRPRDPQLEAELQQLWAMSPDAATDARAGGGEPSAAATRGR